MHRSPVKEGTSDDVGVRARSDGEEAHHGEDHEGRHAAAVFIAGYAQIGLNEVGVDETVDIFLCLPRGTHVVVQVWDVETGFVTHLEHAHQSRGIGQNVVEAPLGRAHAHVEQLIEFGLGLPASAHQ